MFNNMVSVAPARLPRVYLFKPRCCALIVTLTLTVIPCTGANQDQIVAYINAHENELNATVRYGTLDHYLDIVHHGTQIGDAGGDAGGDSAYVHERTNPSNLTFPVVEGDFFANDDQCCQSGIVKKVHSCWSGYFSSFPALKLALRHLDTALRHAEMLSLLATPRATTHLAAWESALGW
jgi:hypothetical protein